MAARQRGGSRQRQCGRPRRRRARLPRGAGPGRASCQRMIRAAPPPPTISGFVLHAQGRTREALPYYADALAIRDATLGPTHPVTAQSLNNLAEALRSEGQRDEAERLHRRAIEIRRTRLAPDHPDLAESLNNLGRAAHRGAPLRRSPGAVRRGAGDPDQGPGRASLGGGGGPGQPGCPRLRARRPRHGRVAPRQVLAIEEAVRAPGDPEIALALGNLAQVLLAADRPQEAAAPARARAPDPDRRLRRGAAGDRPEPPRSGRGADGCGRRREGRAAAARVTRHPPAPARRRLARARAGARRSRRAAAAPRRLRRGPAAAGAGRHRSRS